MCENINAPASIDRSIVLNIGGNTVFSLQNSRTDYKSLVKVESDGIDMRDRRDLVGFH